MLVRQVSLHHRGQFYLTFHRPSLHLQKVKELIHFHLLLLPPPIPHPMCSCLLLVIDQFLSLVFQLNLQMSYLHRIEFRIVLLGLMDLIPLQIQHQHSHPLNDYWKSKVDLVLSQAQAMKFEFQCYLSLCLNLQQTLNIFLDHNTAIYELFLIITVCMLLLSWVKFQILEFQKCFFYSPNLNFSSWFQGKRKVHLDLLFGEAKIVLAVSQKWLRFHSCLWSLFRSSSFVFYFWA